MQEGEGILNSIKRRLASPFSLFVYKKIVFLWIAIFLSMSLVFLLPRLMPSSPAEMMAYRLVSSASGTSLGTQSLTVQGSSASITEMTNHFKEVFEINKPLHMQYLKFWERFFTLNLGRSFWKYPTTVVELLSYKLPWTLALVIPTVPVGFVLGNYIGSRAAFNRGKKDRFFYYFAILFNRFPFYWFGLILVLVFGVKLGIFPLQGSYGSAFVKPVISWDWFTSCLYHYALPFLSIILVSLGGWSLGMRAMTIYEMESDYIDYAKQLGFRDKKLREMAEKNAILPNFTSLPLALSGAIGQTMLIEIVFRWPGLGMLSYRAIFQQDYPVILGTAMITVLIVLIGNFIVDILYGIIDPRIGTGYIEE